MGYLLLGLFLYLAYRFITGFVIPVARTTSQVKRQFSHMKEQMNKAQQQSGAHAQPAHDQKPKYDIEGEYIQFEEIPEQKQNKKAS